MLALLAAAMASREDLNHIHVCSLTIHLRIASCYSEICHGYVRDRISDIFVGGACLFIFASFCFSFRCMCQMVRLTASLLGGAAGDTVVTGDERADMREAVYTVLLTHVQKLFNRLQRVSAFVAAAGGGVGACSISGGGGFGNLGWAGGGAGRGYALCGTAAGPCPLHMLCMCDKAEPI